MAAPQALPFVDGPAFATLGDLEQYFGTRTVRMDTGIMEHIGFPQCFSEWRILVGDMYVAIKNGENIIDRTKPTPGLKPGRVGLAKKKVSAMTCEEVQRMSWDFLFAARNAQAGLLQEQPYIKVPKKEAYGSFTARWNALVECLKLSKAAVNSVMMPSAMSKLAASPAESLKQRQANNKTNENKGRKLAGLDPVQNEAADAGDPAEEDDNLDGDVAADNVNGDEMDSEIEGHGAAGAIDLANHNDVGINGQAEDMDAVGNVDVADNSEDAESSSEDIENMAEHFENIDHDAMDVDDPAEAEGERSPQNDWRFEEAQDYFVPHHPDPLAAARQMCQEQLVCQYQGSPAAGQIQLYPGFAVPQDRFQAPQQSLAVSHNIHVSAPHSYLVEARQGYLVEAGQNNAISAPREPNIPADIQPHAPMTNDQLQNFEERYFDFNLYEEDRHRLGAPMGHGVAHSNQV
ncbi:hypothetical protein QBC40DRAFT_249427 [Triangularia verruculosa]|uniref:Uncharacterized protein n=1 Tax=Triangularia verruculosa TaxID=2587418 RepID=A0AAN6XQF3_9PEZI|nr:hypothetical protein QBC40DRAFT_249427 [Triangularia verruculosa]